jgi:hypothetical protein
MPISMLDGRAVFDGACAVEEAEPLLAWLRQTPDATADLGGCGEVHTALVQLLLAARVPVAVPPADGVLAALFPPAPEAAATPAAAPTKAVRARRVRGRATSRTVPQEQP